MDTTPNPYVAADIRADATRLRKTTNADDLRWVAEEVHGRLTDTDAMRDHEFDWSHPDVDDALALSHRLADLLAASSSTWAVIRRAKAELADAMDAAADELDEQHRDARNLPKTKKKRATRKPAPLRNQTRTADQIWLHDPGAGR